MGELKREELEKILCKTFEAKLTPIKNSIDGFHKTLFGQDGRGGMVVDVSESLKLSKEHETILRGRDRTSGLIKKINYLWTVAFTGAAGLFWKIWDFLSHNPPPPPHH